MQKINEDKSNRSSKRYGKYGLVIALVMMMTFAAAALIDSYGTITGNTMSVESGVTVGDGDMTYVIGDSPAVAGNTYMSPVFTIKNKAETATNITLDTKCNNSDGYDDGTQTDMVIDWIDVVGNDRCDGIVTSYFGIVNLTTKDGSWNPTTGKRVTILYTVVGDDFEYEIINEEGTGFDISDYKLIYYKDDPSSANDAERMATKGTVYVIDKNIGSLPYSDDWNVGELSDYCDNGYDTYTHCTGAKLWLVPEANAVNGLINWVNYDVFLYETDLISYTKGTDNKINLLANGGGFNFVVENSLHHALALDNYTVKTDVTPA